MAWPVFVLQKRPQHLKLRGKVWLLKSEYLQKNSPVITVPHSTLLWELMRLQPIFNFLLKSPGATFEAANSELSCCYQGLILSESSYCRLPGSLAAHPTDTGLTRRWSGIIPVIFAPDWGQLGCVSILTVIECCRWEPGGHLNIKMSSYQYRDLYIETGPCQLQRNQWFPSSHPVSNIVSSLYHSIHVITLRLRQNGRRFADDIFKRIFFNENVRISIKISLKFVR